MVKKTYRISEEIDDFIKGIKDEKGFKYEVDALVYIINEYKSRQNIADEVVAKFNEVNNAWMERIRWATQTAEQNSQITLDVLNTFLFHVQPDMLVTTEELAHTAIVQSQERIKERIAHFKQRKDNRKHKNKE